MPEDKEQLKNGFRHWRFDQIATNVNVRIDNPSESGMDHYVGLEHLDCDSLRIRRWGSPDDVGATKLMFKKGDIIFGRRRAYQRKLGLADFDGICSAHAMVLRAKPEVVLPEFLPFFMQSDSFMTRAVEISVGSLSPTINWKTLAMQEFALPSMNEQLRISNLLRLADGCVESLIEATSSLRQLKKSFAMHAFRKGLRNQITVPLTTHLKEIPVNWKTKSLGDVFNLLDHRRIPIKDSDRNKRKGDFPYYGASGVIDFIDDFIFDEPILLLAEDGMNLIFRSSPLVYKVSDRCWVNNHAHVLQPTNHADIDFFAEYLESISFEPFITGTYQKKITKADCSRIPLPVPPMDEQKQIAEIFATINRQLDSLSMRHAAAKTLLKTLRESALEGEHV